MFQRVLVANRGEIAARVCRALRHLGIEAVAVYTAPDRGAPHTLLADHAVELDAEPRAAYLDAALLVDTAREVGAQAIHPGYGFLSENAGFARACEEADIVFIGPPSEVLARCGDKVQARELAAAAGVPIIPGTREPMRDLGALERAAEEIGLPVMIKAPAGGGGLGTRLVTRAKRLRRELERAASEAEAAFGDGSLYLERALERPRHVEMQIFADGQGNVVYLGERECSIQRRNQKIIEESPSPAVDADLRARLGAAAVAIARGAGYRNAGTVEFLLAPDGQFYFLEVNARLQVEHPVTELCTGLDLVAWQIRVAAGEPLPLTQEAIAPRGHAIECRLYAEDPTRCRFLPNPGRVVRYAEPHGPGVRFDSGIRYGDTVSIHYDPILAKLITHGEDRRQALARMAQALRETTILGIKTSTELLLDIVESEPFASGDTHTGFIDEHCKKQWHTRTARVVDALLGWVVQQLEETGEEGTFVARTDHGEHRFRVSEWSPSAPGVGQLTVQVDDAATAEQLRYRRVRPGEFQLQWPERTALARIASDDEHMWAGSDAAHVRFTVG